MNKYVFVKMLLLLAVLAGCQINSGSEGGNVGQTDDEPGIEGEAGARADRIEIRPNDKESGESPIPDVPVEELREQFEARLWPDKEEETNRVVDFSTLGQWIEHMAEITDIRVAQRLANDYFAEKDDGLYVVPRGGPAMLDLQKSYELDRISPSKARVTQTGDDIMRGKYELTIDYEYRFGRWVIADRTFTSLDISEIEVDLTSLLTNNGGSVMQYHGYAEYGHNETLTEIREEDEATVYIYEGKMNDGSGLTDENGDPFGFQRIVTVTADRMTMKLATDHPDHVTTSLFPEKVWLEKPLKLGHSWTENVTYEGGAYEAVSTIVLVEQDDNGTKAYEVETVIEPVHRFPGNTYKEKIRIEEGKGVTLFQNTMEHLTDPLDEDGYTFGYSLSTVTVKRGSSKCSDCGHETDPS